MSSENNKTLAKITAGLKSGKLADQKCWSFIRDMNSFSEERLNQVALHDGYRKYTYRQMFRYWEKYAEAFSAVKMTGENHSRVAIVGPQQTESVFAFYALNMTGASVSLIYHLDLYDEKRFRAMIEMEKITDLVIGEVFAFPKIMKNLLRDREMLGLPNIILLESPMGGEYPIPPLEAVRKLNASMFREMEGGLLMEDLLKEYEAEPISYGAEASAEDAVVLHTTGTVSGIHKPVPMSDRALNSFVTVAVKMKETYEDFKKAPEHMVTFMGLNMSWVYGMVDMLHTSLGMGMEVVCLPLGVTNPYYAEAIETYGINILFTSMGMLDTWNKSMPDIDLSRVKLVFMGGTYLSPEYKQKFNDYLRSCGSSARVINGYGLSELGGSCVIAPSDRTDDAIGFPLPGFKVKIFVEEENRYYDISDGPRTGLLFLNSPTMSTGRLENTVFFELEKIDEDILFNSHDLVRVNEDGSLTCIGRSNQYFVNNAGVRFDAGLVENAVTSQPGIVACGIAPEFHKILHVPILYVETAGGADGLGTVRDALIQVFIKDGKLADSNLPSQAVLVEKIPLNAGGKVDGKRLASGSVTGKRYNVSPVKVNDRVVDILMIPAAEGESATSGGIPEELENDPYNILTEIFAAIPDLQEGGLTRVLRIPGLRDLVLKLTDLDINNLPGSVNKLAPRLMKLSIDQMPMPRPGKNKKGDMRTWIYHLLSMLEAMDVSDFTAPMPLMPLVPPMPLMPPFLPMMGWGSSDRSGKKKERDSVWDDLRRSIETQSELVREAQKVSMDTMKEQWDKTFPKYMDMQKSFTAALPDEVPFFGFSPRKWMEQVNDFQEEFNRHAREQADRFTDFYDQEQRRARNLISKAAEPSEKDTQNEDEDEKEE